MLGKASVSLDEFILHNCQLLFMSTILHLHTLSELLDVLRPDISNLGIATCIVIVVWVKPAKGYSDVRYIKRLAESSVVRTRQL